jgi:microsomal dipeptidase-like Zn-dependent dipeptidase
MPGQVVRAGESSFGVAVADAERRILLGCAIADRRPGQSLAAMRGPSFEPVDYVNGLENPTDNFANICAWLVQHGYSDDDIRAVLGGNICRVLRHIWVG